MSDTIPDAIVKETVLKAPPSRVWRAITDAAEFGSWFGMRFANPPFEPGKAMTGVIAPTMVDAEIARMQEPHAGTPVALTIADIVPETLFSFRWHPYGIDKAYDYSAEPMTLITFTLKAAEGGTHLTIVESGFHAIPLFRRAEAFNADSGGWEAQMRLIAAWLAR